MWEKNRQFFTSRHLVPCREAHALFTAVDAMVLSPPAEVSTTVWGWSPGWAGSKLIWAAIFRASAAERCTALPRSSTKLMEGSISRS